MLFNFISVFYNNFYCSSYKVSLFFDDNIDKNRKKSFLIKFEKMKKI